MPTWLLAVALSLASLASARPGDGGERYRALTESLARGDFALTQELAPGFEPGSTLARKARLLAEYAAFLGGAGGAPAGEPGVAQGGGAALHLALSPDGAFSAALSPESGVGGHRPLLFGWPRCFSSRVSLSIDGEGVMLSPRGGAGAAGGHLWLVTREGDVEVRLDLVGSAGAPWDPSLVQSASVRVSVTVTNRGGVSKEIGARLLLDLVEAFDDAPLVRVGSGRVLATTTDFTGDGVPRALELGASHRVVLRGLGSPAPDRVVVAPLERALAAAFDFAVEPGEALGADSALAAYLDPVALPPGASRALVLELRGAGSDLDREPPPSTECWTEPVHGGAAGVTRVVLALESSAKGITGAQEDVRVVPHVAPGLELVSAPDDLEHLGDLAPGVRVQRSLVVRDTWERGGSLEVAFDVSARSGAGRSRRTVLVALPPPPALAIRGRILDVQGRPVPWAEVLLRKDGRDLARTTSQADGSYGFAPVGPGAHQILARRVVHREPAAKAGRADLENLLYDVVLSSETLGNDAQPLLPTVLPGEGRDVVLAGSLTRYSIFVSVEWDAPRAYLEQIGRGLRRAAEFLYVASDGQLTYGRVVVADDAENWNGADLYDWANNSVHPNASVNGTRHRYDPVWAPWNTAMNFGRQWAPTWDSHGLYCTVVHEFGHYGLGLFDEYLGAPEGVPRGLAYPEMCRCIMGYQYADHKICWEGNHHAYTNQGMWNGCSCWEQIERWHEGMRSGFYVPVITPRERGGVVPPDFVSHVGEELRLVVHDHDTGAFDAVLSLAGPFGTALDGVLVYTDSSMSARTMYQGVTRGDGTMELMGVHVGDRVRGLKDGARAELVIGERRAAYRLEFDSEPSDELGPPPLVLVRLERANGAVAGASVEVAPLRPVVLPPSIVAYGGGPRVIELEPREVRGEERFVGVFARDELNGGRLRFETVLPDPVRGDSTLVTDAVLGELPAGAETELASFDGSVRLRIPEGVVAEAVPLCIASTAGPPTVSGDARSLGRSHAILPSTEANPFRRPVLLAFRADASASLDVQEVRRYDPALGEFTPLRTVPSPDETELLVELEGPGVVALFRVGP